MMGYCIMNCSTIPHGVYSWAYQTCVPNCTAIRNSDGTVFKSPRGFECPCRIGSSWNSARKECESNSTDCPALSHWNATTADCECDTGNPTPPNQFNLIKDANKNCVCIANAVRNSTFQTNPIFNVAERFCECPNSPIADPTVQVVIVWNKNSGYCECPVGVLTNPYSQFRAVWN